MRFKHFPMRKDSYFEEQLPIFYKGLPSNLAFQVKYDDDNDKMYNTYDYQFDDEYFSGAKNIQDQTHKEEFEYLAPLYLRPENLPSNFVILRVDDAAIYDINTYDITDLTKDNFRTEIIDKWKCVSVFDMTYKTQFGYWLSRNFTENDRFPKSPFEFDAKKYNFSRWYGIDYTYGTYTEKDFFLDDKLYYEQPHFKLEEFITSGYKLNDLVFPNIVNFKFLFDDTPASPFELKKYSINRYYGFYMDDMELVSNTTSYQQPTLIDNLDIINNIFVISGTTGTTMPFINTWDDNEEYYIYAKSDLYRVIKKKDNGIDTYKIISDVNLSISDINSNNIIDIVYQNTGETSYINIISGRTEEFLCDTYVDDTGHFKGLYGDLYLIDIDDKYHVLKVDQDLIHHSAVSYTENTLSNTIATNAHSTFFNDNDIYIGTDDGLLVYDREYIFKWSATTSNSLLPNNSINNIHYENDILYVGTDDGMWIKDFNTGIEDQILSTNSNIGSATDIQDICINNNKIYACALSGSTNVIWSLDLSDKYDITIYELTNDWFTNIQIKNDNLYVISTDSVTSGGSFGIFYDLDTKASVYYDSGNTSMEGYPTSFDIDDDMTLFIGTNNGIFIKKETYEKNISQTTGYDISGITENIFYNTDNNTLITKYYNSVGGGVFVYDILNDDIDVMIYSADYENNMNEIFFYDNIISIVENTQNNYDCRYYTFPSDSYYDINLRYYIDTDYAISSNSSKLKYWIESEESEFSINKDIRTNKKYRKPLMYPIYRMKFSDIKDWDFDRVDTDYSNFDYEKTEYIDTEEHKLYTTEFRDNSIPKQFKVMPVGSIGQNKITNVSSEYISTDELFEITENKDLNNIWIKNETVCKWGYMTSISHSDYPYKLNNNNKVGSMFNKTTNIFKNAPSIIDKNMDYMYRVGNLHNDGVNQSYLQQSTNIETSLMNDESQKFNLELYINSDFDYFDYFFKNKMNYEYNDLDYLKSTSKYSIFKLIDNFNPVSTLFKGLKINLESVDMLYRDDDYKFESVITGSKKYDDYKCSIIFNPCYQYIETYYDSDGDSGETLVDYVEVSGYSYYQPRYMDVINWHYEDLGQRGYYTGQTLNYSTFNDTGSTWGTPYSDGVGDAMAYLCDGTIKLKRSYDASFSDYKNYYIKLTGFTFDEFSLRAYDFYDLDMDGIYSHFKNGIIIPIIPHESGATYLDESGTTTQLYRISASTSDDVYISLDGWDEDDLSTHFYDFVIYGADYELYEVVDELNFESAGIINKDYIDTSNTGIDVFLNDKYKNVLIVVNTKLTLFKYLYDLNNVSVFGENYGYYYAKSIDGTIMTTSGINYSTQTLTASNVISALNDLNNKYGFDRNVYYHYIDDNSNYGYINMEPSSIIDGNMEDLESWGKDFPPYLINVERPDTLILKKKSFDHEALRGPRTNIYDKYKPKNRLTSVNYDIDEPISRKITINENEITKKVQQHGENQVYNKEVYRYSGPYEPIFKDIELFDNTDYSLHDGIFCQKSFAGSVSVDEMFSGFTGATYTGFTEWSNIENLIGETDGQYATMKYDILTTGSSSLSTYVFVKNNSTKIILNDFNFNIPEESDILEINVFFKKRIGLGKMLLPPNYFHFKDNELKIIIDGNESIDLSKSTTYQNYWTIEKYTLNDIPEFINFDLNVEFDVENYFYYLNDKNRRLIQDAQFDSVEVQVCYTMPNVESNSYFKSLESNYKFNDTYERFGKVSEIVYSKVNTKENIFKIKSNEDRSIYPMVDEYGYGYKDRFIFKSTWDKEYYILTENEVLDTSGDDAKKNT